MKVIGPTTIAKLIEAHIDNDDEKFFSYANFIADAYEEQGEDRAAKIIRNRITGEYKTAPQVVLDFEDHCEDAISRDFQIGDEVRIIGSDPILDDCDVGWVIRNASERVETMYVMRNDGSADEENKANWYRTGRHNAVLAEVIKALPPVAPSKYKEHWIYVKDRLPTREEYIESNGLFIVSDGNRSYAEYFDIYDKQMFGEPTMEGFRVDKCVSKWMPLPKPCDAEMENEAMQAST